MFLDTASLLSGVCILLDNRQETFTEFAQPSHAILMLGCGNSRLSEENDGSHKSSIFWEHRNSVGRAVSTCLFQFPHASDFCWQEMYEEGYHSITNIDLCMTVIKAMQEKYRDKPGRSTSFGVAVCGFSFMLYPNEQRVAIRPYIYQIFIYIFHIFPFPVFTW